MGESINPQLQSIEVDKMQSLTMAWYTDDKILIRGFLEMFMDKRLFLFDKKENVFLFNFKLRWYNQVVRLVDILYCILLLLLGGNVIYFY